MKAKKLWILILFLPLFLSCAEELGTGTLKINLHCNVPKTLTGGNSSMDIVKFTVTGQGPGGKTFTVDTTSSSVSLDGIVLGQWKVAASGYNSQGKEIASGEASFELEESSSIQNVDLEVLTGEGSLSVKFSWDSDVKDPVLKITLLQANQSNALLEKNISVGTGKTNYTFSLSGLNCGTYLLKAELYNSSVKVTGTCQALRITRADKTSGSINFCREEELSSDLEDLYVVTDSYPIKGHIDTSFSGQADSSKSHYANLVLDTYLEDKSNYRLKWYIDGVEVCGETVLDSSDNTVIFETENGIHFLDAVVYEKDLNTVGSASCKFISKIVAKQGSAVLCSTVKKDSIDCLYLAEDSIISALSNNRFALLTPSEGTLQIISVYNNSIAVHSTVSAQNTGFSWLCFADGLYSCPEMKMFAITDNKKNITLLSFKEGSDSVEIAHFDEEELRIEGQYKPLWTTFTDIYTVYLAPGENGAGTIIICNGGTINCIAMINDGSYVTKRGLMLMSCENCAGFDFYEDLCVSISSSSNKIYTASFENGAFSTFWQDCSTSLSTLTDIRFLNKENIVVASDSGLVKFTIYSDRWMEYQKLAIEVSKIEVSNDGMFIYCLDGEGLLTTFSVKTGRMIRLGQTNISTKAKQLCLNGNDMLALDYEGNLVVLTIAKEDIE